jgi:RecA/RadA recombinase
MAYKTKFDLNAIVAEVYKENTRKSDLMAKLGTGDNLKELSEDNFLIMPKWWQDATGTFGIPYGGMVQIAGDSDSGKTSCAIEAMKAAQAQGAAVLYIETEGKTTKNDLQSWGLDTSQIMLAQSAIAEKAFSSMFKLWDKFNKHYPGEKLLVVFDSIGNVVSQHDEEMDMAETNQRPGGKGKTNRAGINLMISRCEKHKAAILVLNYTYDNIGSPGKTNAGGKSLNFFSSLTYQTTRKGWYEIEKKGVKIRKGADVRWTLFKNHINKTNPGPKIIDLRITAEGIELLGVNNG